MSNSFPFLYHICSRQVALTYIHSNFFVLPQHFVRHFESSRAIKPHLRATSGFFWNRCIDSAKWHRLRIVPLSLSPSCVTRKKTGEKNGRAKSWERGAHERRDCRLSLLLVVYKWQKDWLLSITHNESCYRFLSIFNIIDWFYRFLSNIIDYRFYSVTTPGWGDEPGSTEKQLHPSGQSGTWTCDLQISSLVPQSGGYAAFNLWEFVNRELVRKIQPMSKMSVHIQSSYYWAFEIS